MCLKGNYNIYNTEGLNDGNFKIMDKNLVSMLQFMFILNDSDLKTFSATVQPRSAYLMCPLLTK